MRDFDPAHAVRERMVEIGLELCVHSEVPDVEVEKFDRENVIDVFCGSALYNAAYRSFQIGQ